MLLAFGGCAAVLLLRVPSFFEPAWHTDEGTFAGVAEGIVRGRSLYAEAWESKPPLFLYLYAGIFKVFGVGVLQLRLAATVAALSTQFAMFLLAGQLIGWRRALIGSLLLGVMLAVPFWEGNLALSEIFSIPLAAAGVLILVLSRRDRDEVTLRACFAAGVLFGLAALIRQPTALALPAVAIWLWLEGALRPRSLAVLASASVGPLCVTMLGFALFGSFHWFWDANVSYFFAYVPADNRLELKYWPLLILPLATTLVLLLWSRRRGEPTPAWGLAALWFGFAFVGALMNGKDYSHYLLQCFPPLTLLVAGVSLPSFQPGSASRWRPAFALAAVIAVSWYVVVNGVYFDTLGRHWTKGTRYYKHVFEYAIGRESKQDFNAYFDKRVNTSIALAQELDRLDAEGQSAYIWGEYPWVYALSHLKPVSRYVTSSYMLEDDEKFPELMGQLNRGPPEFIVLCSDARPKPIGPETKARFERIDGAMAAFVQRRYERVAQVGNGAVYRLRPGGRAWLVYTRPGSGAAGLKPSSGGQTRASTVRRVARHTRMRSHIADPRG